MASQPRSEDLDLDSLLPPFRATDPASHWLFSLQRLGIRPGLERIEVLLEALGHPQQQFESIVVAGTNGKGTAATYLAALARASGLRCGLYTSPHFLRVHERILVDGRAVGEGELAELVRECRPLIESTGATFFEAMTAICLLHFARTGVELAILETGLGGRLDATNVVDASGCLLTSVGADHQHILGSSEREIAAEKLGLAKPGKPFYLGRLDPSLRAYAHELLTAAGSEIVDLGELPSFEGPLAQRGHNQARLAAVVKSCYADLAQRRGWPVGDLDGALAAAHVPCRYEIVGQSPELILDTAHNAPALQTLLEQWGREGRRENRLLILGVMRDKKIDDVLSVAAGSAQAILVTAPQWYRALDPVELASRLREIASVPSEIEHVGSLRASLEEGRRRASGLSKPSILVTGSNFLVAEALDRLAIDDIHDCRRSSLWDQGLPLRSRRATEGEVARS